jgi:DNA repair protein SbcC/Rad50
MRLISLSLNNIRSYVNETIDFPKGNTVIIGDIGSGKSTILLSIEFALFGIVKGFVNSSMLLRHGEEEGSVILRFELDKKEVIIKRQLKKTKQGITQDSGYIVIDGEKTEATALELRAKILEILGYSKDFISKSKNMIFRYTVFTPQEEMKQILYESEEERLNVLRKVFGIDKYKRIVENSKIIIRELKERKILLEGRVQDLYIKKEEKEKIIIQIKESEEKIKILLSQLNEINEKIKNQKKIIENLEKKQEFCRKIDEKNNLTKQKLENINEKIKEFIKRISVLEDETKEKLNELPNIDNLKKEIIDFKKEKFEKDIILKEKEKEFIKFKESLSQNNRLLSDYEKDKKILLSDIEKIKINISKENPSILNKDLLIKEYNHLISLVKDIDIKLKNEYNSFSRLKAINDESIKLKERISSLDVCPTCQQTVDDNHKKSIITNEKKKEDLNQIRIDEIEKFIESLEFQKKESLLKIESLDKDIKENLIAEQKLKFIVEQKKRIQENESKIIILNDRINSVKKNNYNKDVIILEIEKEISKFKDIIIQIDSSLEIKEKKYYDVSILYARKKDFDKKIKDLNEFKNLLEKYNNDKNNIEKDIIKLQEEKEKISFSKDDLEKSKVVLDEYFVTERNLSLNNAQEQKINEKNKELLDNLGKEIIEKELLKEKARELNILMKWMLGPFEYMIKEIEQKVMKTIYKEFDDLFQRWFSSLIEDDNLKVKLNENFTPLIIQNGYDSEYINLSGGEKTSCALSYRLALNKVINDLLSTIKTKDIIILDEPTDGFSTQQLEKLKEVITQLDISQIIIVSHERQIESFFENFLLVEKRDNQSIVKKDIR